MLTMEETFIATGIFILVAGISLGLLIDWLITRAEKKKEEDPED